MRFHYELNDIDKALNALPLEKGSTLFIHSNLGFFGNLNGDYDAEDLSSIYYEKIMNRLGHNGTIIVPAFTDSFPKGESFNPDLPISEMGIFSEFIHKLPDSLRSNDPSYSVVAVGKIAKKLIENPSENSFDENSFFSRFLNCEGVILNLNFDAGSTFLHFIERQLNVSYRYDKRFKGNIILNDKSKIINNTIYVRDLNDSQAEPSFEAFTSLTREKKLFRTKLLGRGELGCIKAIDCKDMLEKTLPEQPWLLTKAGVSNNISSI